MEFDKSRVYTALNADELKIGSKVILSDNLSYLKECVEHGDDIVSLVAIKSEAFSERFFDGGSSWCLAYLVAEPEEKKLKWTDLKVGDVIRKDTYAFMVTGIDDDTEDATDRHIYIGQSYSTGDGAWLSNDELKKWVKVDKGEQICF